MRPTRSNYTRDQLRFHFPKFLTSASRAGSPPQMETRGHADPISHTCKKKKKKVIGSNNKQARTFFPSMEGTDGRNSRSIHFRLLCVSKRARTHTYTHTSWNVFERVSFGSCRHHLLLVCLLANQSYLPLDGLQRYVGGEHFLCDG